jgi:hypothetical protein
VLDLACLYRDTFISEQPSVLRAVLCLSYYSWVAFVVLCPISSVFSTISPI